MGRGEGCFGDLDGIRRAMVVVVGGRVGEVGGTVGVMGGSVRDVRLAEGADLEGGDF